MKENRVCGVTGFKSGLRKHFGFLASCEGMGYPSVTCHFLYSLMLEQVEKRVDSWRWWQNWEPDLCCGVLRYPDWNCGRTGLSVTRRSAAPAHKSILNVNRTDRQRPAHGGPFGARGLGHHYFLPGVSSVMWFRWTPERRSSRRVSPAQGQGDSEPQPAGHQLARVIKWLFHWNNKERIFFI